MCATFAVFERGRRRRIAAELSSSRPEKVLDLDISFSNPSPGLVSSGPVQHPVVRTALSFAARHTDTTRRCVISRQVTLPLQEHC
jgi:hypothetical protein